MVAVSHASSPESNRNSPSPVKILVGHDPTNELIDQSLIWVASLKIIEVRLVIVIHRETARKR